MTPNLVQRDHTYVLGPNQDARLASLAAGQVIQGLTVPVDSDAPFILRGRALRCKYDSSRFQTGLNHVLAKWAGPDRNYRSQDYIRQSLLAPYFGQLGNPIPVWPNMPYPKNGVITVDVKNDGTSAITNLTFYFRGVKLFAPGAVKGAMYPGRLSPFPYVYPQTVNNLPVSTFTSVVAGGVYTGIRQIFRNSRSQPISDADFVIRGIQAGLPFSTTPVNEVFLRLFDEDEKPYSNDAVHIDVYAGNSCFPSTYPAGTSAGVAPIGAGPNSMGVLFPEIYLPKQHILYYEVSRNDTGFAGAATVNFPLAFIGQKVFAK